MGAVSVCEYVVFITIGNGGRMFIFFYALLFLISNAAFSSEVPAQQRDRNVVRLAFHRKGARRALPIRSIFDEPSAEEQAAKMAVHDRAMQRAAEIEAREQFEADVLRVVVGFRCAEQFVQQLRDELEEQECSVCVSERVSDEPVAQGAARSEVVVSNEQQSIESVQEVEADAVSSSVSAIVSLRIPAASGVLECKRDSEPVRISPESPVRPRQHRLAKPRRVQSKPEAASSSVAPARSNRRKARRQELLASAAPAVAAVAESEVSHDDVQHESDCDGVFSIEL